MLARLSTLLVVLAALVIATVPTVLAGSGSYTNPGAVIRTTTATTTTPVPDLPPWPPGPAIPTGPSGQDGVSGQGVSGQAAGLSESGFFYLNLRSDLFRVGATVTGATTNTNVYMRYRVNGSSGWSTIGVTNPQVATASNSYQPGWLVASGVSPSTTYDVQVSLSSTFAAPIGQYATKTAYFRTPATGAAVLESIVGGSQAATASTLQFRANVHNGGGSSRVISYRYRQGTGSWSAVSNITSSSRTTNINLSGLTANSTYTMQARIGGSSFSNSLDYRTWTLATAAASPPSLSRLAYISRTTNSLTFRATVDNPGGVGRTVYYRYGQGINPSSWSAWTSRSSPASTASAATVSLPITGLSALTTYKVEATLTSSGAGARSGSRSLIGTTAALVPSLSGLAYASGTSTGLTFTATITNGGGTTRTIYYRYGQGSNPSAWTTGNTNSSASSVSLSITGLSSSTTYTMQASLTSGFGSGTYQSASGTTSAAVPSLTRLAFLSRTTNSLTFRATVDNPGGVSRTVYYRYGQGINPSSWSAWSSRTASASAATVSLPITGLSALTTYKLEATLTSSGAGARSGSRSLIGTTAALVPSVSSLAYASRTPTSLTFSATVANPGGASRTVYYRIGQGSSPSTWSAWTSRATTASSGATVNVLLPITGLTSSTTYTVQATLTSTGSGARTGSRSASGTTAAAVPSISSVTDASRTSDSLTFTVAVSNGGGTSRTIYYRYRTGTDPWITGNVSTALSSYSLTLSGLDDSSTYTLQASLTSPVSDSNSESATGTTLAPPPATPSLTNMAITAHTNTSITMTATIANGGGVNRTISYRYRNFGQSFPQPSQTSSTTSTGNSVSVTFSGLSSRTVYALQISLNSSFSPVETLYATTGPISVSAVALTNYTSTSLTFTATVSDEDGQGKVVYYRYREWPSGAWSNVSSIGTHILPVSERGSVPITISSLTTGTTYELQAKMSNYFADSGEASATGTPSLNTRINDLEYVSRGDNSLRFTATVQDGGGTSRTIYYRYRASGAASWTTDDLDSAAASVNIDLSSLTTSTVYEVQASLTSPVSDSNSESATGTTSGPPRIGPLSDNGTDATNLRARGTIINGDGTNRTYYWRFREVGSSGAWHPSGGLTRTSSGDTVFASWGANPNDYRLQMSLTNTWAAGTYSEIYLTVGSNPGPTGVTLSGLVLASDSTTATSLTFAATVSNPGGVVRTVYYRYGQGSNPTSWSDWDDRGSAVTSGATATVLLPITGLTAGTAYTVQATLTSTGADARAGTSSASGTTSAAALPSLSGLVLSSGSTTATGLTFTATVSNPGGVSRTVYYRYGQGSNPSSWSTWGNRASTASTASTVTVSLPITGLTAATTYTVQATLTSTGADARTGSRSASGTTSSGVAQPSIGSVTITNRAQTAATATVSISDPGSSSLTVYLRVRVAGGAWGTASTRQTATGSAVFSLTGLTAGTNYEVQAALNSAFTSPQPQTFSTLAAAVIRVSGIQTGNLSHNSASVFVTVANPDGNTQTVNLRYRPRGSSDAWSEVSANTNTASTDFSLFGLEASTTYDLQASLDSTFPPGTETATQQLSTTAAPETPVRLNESVRLEPDPSQYRYRNGDSRTFELVGEDSLFPVVVYTRSSNIRITGTPGQTCETAGDRVDNLDRGDEIRVLVCTDAFGNAIVSVDEAGGNERSLARYPLPLDRRDVPVEVDPVPLFDVTDPRVTDAGGDAIGLAIVINSFCGLMGAACDTGLISTFAVLAVALAVTVIPTVFSLQTGYPIGTMAFGFVLGILVLMLGYLFGVLPLWMAGVAVLAIGMIGFLALAVTFRGLGRM